MNFANIWQHPNTTALGLLICIVTATGVLEQQGISLGTAGTGTVVALVGALASAFLGLFAQDPKKGSNGTNTAKQLGIALLIGMLISMPALEGCTQQQKVNVAQEIVNWAPSLTSAVNAIAATGAVLQPQYAVAFGIATAGFDALSLGLQSAAKDYLANPSQTTLQLLQAEVVKFQQSVNTSLLQVAGIKDPASQRMALAAINALATVVNTILALVQSVSTKAQIAAMKAQVHVTLAQVRPYMDTQGMQMASLRVTRDLGLGHAVMPNEFFAYEAQAGF